MTTTPSRGLRSQNRCRSRIGLTRRVATGPDRGGTPLTVIAARRPLALVGAGVAVALTLTLTLALAGCVQAAPAPVPIPTTTPTPGETIPPEPELNLNGTAAQNQGYFDQVNLALISAGGTLDGAAFVNSLEVAGYLKATMEVTPDRTAADNASDNIQFSVRLNGTCLIGQYGNTGYSSTYGPQLSDDRCLIGTTRPIDF